MIKSFTNAAETTVTIPAEIDVGGVKYTVTGIADGAFRNKNRLEKVVIPRSVTEISDGTDKLGAFQFCGINGLTPSTNLRTIGSYAFSGCPNLKVMIIPSTVTSMGYKVFAGCVDLTVFGESGSAAESYVRNDNEDISFVDIYAKISNAKPEQTDSGVQLSWDKIDTNIKGYKIYKIVYRIYRNDLTDSSASEVVIADTESNSFLDKNVTDRHKYNYFINCTYCFTAKDEEYTIDTSRVAIGEVSINPSTKPRNVKAEAGDGCATITWDRVEGATQYRIYQVTSRKFITVADTAETSYTVKGLTNGTTYRYLALAVINGKWSTYTEDDIAYVTADDAIKPFVVAQPRENGDMYVVWSSVNTSLRYKIFVREVGGDWEIAGATRSRCRLTIGGYDPAKTYEIMVRGFDKNAKKTPVSAEDIVTCSPLS